MSMHGYDASFYDYGFSYPAISSSLYGNSLSPMAAAIDYDEDVFVRRRPPARQRSPSKNPSSPPKHRHDGTSPLPLGMDWSLPPRIWKRCGGQEDGLQAYQLMIAENVKHIIVDETLILMAEILSGHMIPLRAGVIVSQSLLGLSNHLLVVQILCFSEFKLVYNHRKGSPQLEEY